jgi:putative PIN family toxin of toxin-antitoxin system
MGKKKITPRVVFDTNVVLSALIFATGQLAWLRHSWRKGLVVPLLAETTVLELMTVLAYSKFHLTPDDIENLLADYLPFGHSIHPLLDQPDAPRCRDPHDQMFVDLALAGHADYLVTGDKDLLALSGLLSCQVITPAVFREMMGEIPEF